jgi:nicotinamide riboside kinase
VETGKRPTAQILASAAAIPGKVLRIVNHTFLKERPLIAVVGPCASGKSQLVRALRSQEYNAREVVQEHSHVPTMWQRITQPDLLIYLDVSWEIACQRRPTTAKAAWWDELSRRLRHARQHADLYIHTDALTPQEVFEETLAFLKDVLHSPLQEREG